MRALFALFGAGFGAAVLILITALRPPTAPPARRTAARSLRARLSGSALRVAGILTATALVGAVTRWPIGAVLAGVAAGTLPRVLGPDRDHRRTLDRLEAIAAWADDLAGTLRSAAGIEQAIITSADT